MADKRKIILDRVFALLQAIPGVTHSFRNRGDLKEELRPAVLLLDGTESADGAAYQRGRVAVSPNVITMQPQIFVLPVPKDLPGNNGVTADIEDWRRKIIRALTLDDQLISFVGPNGQIEYRGMDTDMQSGSTMVGEIQFHFAFRYVLDPATI